MNRIPTPLKPGDLIALVAPAKNIEQKAVDFAKSFFENEGFTVQISENCLGSYHYFSGTIAERLADFQMALDDPNVKAIICVRGGYGCIQLIDRIQWASQLDDPKWIVGFSDVTIMHQRMQHHGIASIHGTMPLNFETNSKESLTTLVSTLKGKPSNIIVAANNSNKLGSTEGVLLGGNLSILYSLIGTDDEINFENAILYIEEVGEHLYQIDRMFYAFEKAGILEKIKGLIVGGMTNIKDTATPFGKNYQEIILTHFQYKSIPILFDFPAGHFDDNRALVLGAQVNLSITKKQGQLIYI